MKYYIVEKYSYAIGESSDKSYKVYYASIMETEDLRMVDGELEFTHASTIRGADESMFTKEPYQMRTVESQSFFLDLDDAFAFYDDYVHKSYCDYSIP